MTVDGETFEITEVQADCPGCRRVFGRTVNQKGETVFEEKAVPPVTLEEKG